MTDDCKRHFRLKVRDILDRLIRKYGADSITPHIPPSDTVMLKRLKNLRKLNARKKKLKEMRKEQEEEEGSEEDFIVHAKPKSVEEILADSDSDFDDMETDQQKPAKNKRKVNTWIEEDPDSIVDFTDPSALSKITGRFFLAFKFLNSYKFCFIVLATKPGQTASQPFQEKKKNNKDRGFKTAADGRLIIEANDSDSDTDKKKKSINFSSDSESEDESTSAAETLPLTNRKRKRTDSFSMKSGFSGVSSQASMKYKSGGVGIHRPLGASTSSQKTPGVEYRSKKAKGDVKKKGKFDPYAYLPLQRSALNKRFVFIFF